MDSVIIKSTGGWDFCECPQTEFLLWQFALVVWQHLLFWESSIVTVVTPLIGRNEDMVANLESL